MQKVAKELAGLKIKIEGKDGDTGKFNIMSIGRYGLKCSPYSSLMQRTDFQGAP